MSAKSIWKGTLSFGLVAVQVKAYKATDEPNSETSMRQLHKTCNTPINQVTRCAKCNIDIAGDVIKGVEQADGTFVILTKEDLDSIKPESSDVIRIDSFVKVLTVDSLYVRDTYYLSADGAAATESYALLRAALDAEGLAGQGQWAVYGREHNVIVRACNGGLAVQMMRSVNEVRPMDALPGYAAPQAVTLNPAMFKLAKQLVTANVEPFDATDYEDEYVTEFKALVVAKANGTTLPGKAVAKVVPAGDLMAALTASLAHKPVAKKKVPKATAQAPPKRAKKEKVG